MAYIPPHKRHSSSSPAPESLLIPRFRRNLSLSGGNSSDRSTRKDKGSGAGYNIVYADNSINKWFAVGLPNSDNDDGSSPNFSALTRFDPVSVESFQGKSGENRFALVLKEDAGERGDVFVDQPLVVVVENVKRDLLSSFQRVKIEMAENEHEVVKPGLVARVGRVLFHGNPSSLHSRTTESSLRTSKRTFYTNVRLSHMEHITDEFVRKAGLNFEGDKEKYIVKISDNLRPDSTISCKCAVAQDHKSIELCKIQLNPVRHLVADISCLGKSVDMRLMLNTKKIVVALTNEEVDCIKALISWAVLDSDIKGGLRWPLGKDSFEGRYTIVGVWHTNSKTYRNSSFRLKVRRADRFNFILASGEVTGEVLLNMHGIIAQMQKHECENDPVVQQMLGENIKLIWDHLLCFESSI